LISKKRRLEILLTILFDYIALVTGWYIFYQSYSVESEVFTIIWGITPFASGFLLSFYWVIILTLFGLYKRIYLISRLDEFIRVFKATVIGTFILFFLITTTQHSVLSNATYSTLYYWCVITLSVATVRFIIRSVQRQIANMGKGLHKAVIVGVGRSACEAYKNLQRNRTLGMEVVGFIEPNGKNRTLNIAIDKDLIVGHIDDIDSYIMQNSIEDVIVALEPAHRDDLVKVISRVDIPDVTVKILPDFHQLVSGLNKTNQIFGLPLIEISPDPMPIWEKVAKRILDIAISAACLIITLPLITIVAIWIKLDSEGPVIYKQQRVGRFGKVFTIYKFRTMKNNAEQYSGPKWAEENDPRITRAGYWLRKLRLDEIPQCLNVLKGEMSLVGPRPERPYFIQKFRGQIPLYSRRLRVRPGITGWAQVKWKYDSTLEDVEEKTKYDLFYVENISLRMDFKILINTIITIIKAKGQ